MIKKLLLTSIIILLSTGCQQRFNTAKYVTTSDGQKRERACSFVNKAISEATDTSSAYSVYQSTYSTSEMRRIKEIDRQCIQQRRLERKDYSDYMYLKKKLDDFKKRAERILEDAAKR